MRRLIVFLFLLACFASVGKAQTWTFVQDSVITSCTLSSSCNFSSGNVIPTQAGSVMIVRIHTKNNVTITSVSGGGGSWQLCPANSCHVFDAAFNDNQDLAYNLSGTGGASSFTVNLSGTASGFFGGNFMEFLPPTGSTPSLDGTPGTVSSSTCTPTCTGVALTLSATDLVVQVLSGNGVSGANAWKAYSAPYITDYAADGINLNATSGTAPTISSLQGPGADFTGIAFKTSLGSYSPPAQPISIVNYTSNTQAGITCSTTCSFTIPSTVAGHLLYLQAGGNSSLLSVSGGGTWVIPSGCKLTVPGSTGGTLSCAYVLSSTAGATTINVTMAGSGQVAFALWEIATTTGAFSLDAIGSAQRAGSPNLTIQGEPLTLAGSLDAIFQAAWISGGSNAISFYPTPENPNGQANFFYSTATSANAGAGTLLNTTNGTAPIWINGGTNSAGTGVTGVAFSTTPPTINAATCNATDVQTALNSVAVDGTTVVLPACPTSSNIQWTGTGPAVTYNQAFSTILQGQSTVATSDSNGRPLTFNDQTAICDLVSGSSNPTFQISTAAGKTFRMTGISFVANCGQVTARNTGVINVRGDSHSFRMDHNHFNGAQGPRFLNIASADVLGVIDHNLFDEANAVNINYIEVNGANYNASGDQFGDASWTDVSNFGTGIFVFAEDNTFNATISTGAHSFDIQQGGRIVFRHNTSHNSPFQSHAVGHDGPTFRDRGPRAYEVYQNILDWPNGGAPFAFVQDYEGGSSLWWGNSVTSGAFNNFLNMDYRRATGFTYSQVATPNGWGYCGSLQTGPNGPGPSIWDESRDTSGVKCLDGTGMGKGDLLTGTTWPNVNNNVTGTQAWLRQARDPVYVWLNTLPGISSPVVSGQSDTSSVNNRDYYFDAASFNGTVGVGNGTLTPSTSGAYTNAPACTNGVGYWQTNTQTFFQCQGSWGPMDAWLPFSHGTPGAAVTTTTLNSDAKGPAISWCINSTCLTTTPGLTFNVTQGDMGGSITVAGVTYPNGTATQAVALNDGNNFTYATGTVSSGQKQVVGNGYITFGATNAGSSGLNWDLVLLNDTNSSAAVILQLNNGQPCYCVRIETNGTGGTQRSANITLTPGNRYAFSLLFDEIGGQAKLAIFDPTNGYAQVGSTVQVAQDTGFNFSSLRFGNAEAGTSTGNTYFEDLMLDWTNHVFPNKPTTSWVQYYQPFTYPHPLVSSGGGGSPAVNLNPASLTFTSQLVGTSSTSQQVILTNIGTAALNITSISVTGANVTSWSQINNCGSSLGAGFSCSITVTFSPVTPGSLPAGVSIVSNSPTSPDVITLSGFGLTSVISGKGSISGTAIIKVNP